jgi:radical SAM protein with 4Fe4S-binding SPASM domain
MYKVKSACLHITKSCTHGCPYCYYTDSENKKDLPDDLQAFDLNTLKLIIDELSRFSVDELCFLGGDPAKYPFILELAEYAHRRNLFLTSVSNTHNYPCTINDIVKYVSVFETTIHSSEKKLHDKFCKYDGAFDCVLENLKEIQKLGAKTGITVNITPSNVHDIYDIADVVINTYGVRINYINIQRIVATGSASCKDSFSLSKGLALKALTAIEAIKNDFKIDITVEDPFPLCKIPSRYWKYMSKCAWGYDKVSINGDGNMSRCGADPRYSLGNILEKSLDDLWKHSPALKIFREKKFLPNECQKCPQLEICGGGCALGCENSENFQLDSLLREAEK